MKGASSLNKHRYVVVVLYYYPCTIPVLIRNKTNEKKEKVFWFSLRVFTAVCCSVTFETHPPLNQITAHAERRRNMYNLHVFSVKKYSSFRIAVVVVAGKGSLKCFEIRMPQVFQDSQVAGNIYASCDMPIGLLFSAVVIYDCWTYFLYEWENLHPPWREKPKKMG